MIKDLLAKLNPAQCDAVTAPPGPLLIIAGAGSGKTRVLTHRLAHFISSGVRPRHILAITFTNKAADEMRSRVLQLIQSGNKDLLPLYEAGAWGGLDSRLRGNDNSMPFIGTFHSFALRILREDCTALEIPKTFVVADEADSSSIMKRAMKQMRVKPDEIAPSEALNRISQEKNELRSPDEMNCNTEKEELIRTLYRAYQQTLSNEKLLDFDDLLFFAVKLLQKHAAILEKYQNRFRHILIDEYQDTNTAQYVLIKMLAQKHRSLTVVGDDYQAIYGWRGADYRNILNFRDDYPEATVVKLEQNYRSTQTILDAADGIIKKVAARTEKTLIATKPAGSLVAITELPDERMEAEFVIAAILELTQSSLRVKRSNPAHTSRLPRRLSYFELKEQAPRNDTLKLSDVVILYRTNAQSRPFEEILVREHIPYRIIGGLRFYERREIKDVLAFLRYLHNETDRTALERIINIPPRGIGKIGLERIFERGLDAVADTSEPARDFRAMLRALREKQSMLPLAQFIKDFLHAINYKAYLREAFSAQRTWSRDQSDERWENILELIGMASRYDALTPGEALERFLEDVALFSHTDALDTSTPALNLMTMHLAKGLEFPAVFLVGCEEGLLPHARSMYNSESLDEERRLCYVALTRAKDVAHLTFTRARSLHGDSSRRLPSRFLNDIPEHLIEFRGSNLSGSDVEEIIDEWEDEDF